MRWVRRLAFLVPLAAVLALASSVQLPYYSLAPGPVRAVQPLIRFDGPLRYESEGSFVLTSVRFQRLTAIGILSAWVDPDRDVVPRSTLFAPGETPEEERRRASSQMDQSKLAAISVVLRELTAYPREHGDGVLVEGVVDGCAADGRLYPGDLIHAVDGTEVRTVREARRAIGSVPSGSRLTFDVTVDGEPRTVRLLRAPCGGSEDPLVGVSLINSFPFDVRISSGEIGGPSAGLMWALGLYDLLTPGDLTGGRTIAGTGLLATDGTVHPIGSIGEKILAAAEAGATVLLVPEGNLTEARGLDDRGLELVPVASFADALAYLEDGG